AERLPVVDVWYQVTLQSPEDSQGLDFLVSNVRRNGCEHLEMLTLAIIDFDLVAAHVPVGRPVGMEDVKSAARADGERVDRPAAVGIVQEKAVKLRLHPELDPDLERLPDGELAGIVFPVPLDALGQRAGPKRLRRVLPKHPGGQVSHSFPRGILDE